MGLVTMSNSLSILLLEPILSTSHHIWTVNLLKGLLSKGHHVHVISIHEPDIKNKLAQNMTHAVSICYKKFKYILDKTITSIFIAQFKSIAYITVARNIIYK